MKGPAKLRHDLVLVEQTYRGEQSFIVKDPQSRKYFRFRPVEVMVMQALDGEHPASEIAAALAEEGLRVSPATVDAFAAKLTAMGLCERTLSERSVLQMERLRAERRRRLGRGIFQGNLLRLRWSVGDPDKLFDRWLPRLRFFFTRTFLAVSVGLFALYLLVLGLKWPEFSGALADLYTLNFDASTLAVFWLTGTAIIVVHELGHGFTCKYFGGQVHEIGAMLIYFEPAFYCNVNDAWTFPDRRARLWVTAAGSWIQLVIASLAAIVWWAATPGTVTSQIAFAAVLIGGITTVFMNANPLIPLDGYYALSDYLEVPNLRQRAFGYLAWLAKTRVFRLDLPRPPADERERRVFLVYGSLAGAYIALILSFFAATALGWLTRWLGVVGLLLFLVGLAFVLRAPAREWIGTARVALRRLQATLEFRSWQRRLGTGMAALIVLGVVVPWPITVTARFSAAPLVVVPHVAPDSGIVRRVQVLEGVRVTAGAPLLQIRNIELERELAASQRISDSLASRIARARGQARQADLAVLEAERAGEEARLAGLRERVAALGIRALGTGLVITHRPQDLVGQWVSSGETVLLVGRLDSVEIRIVVAGAGGSLVRPGARVSLLPDATRKPVSAGVREVSTAARSPESVEARLHIPTAGSWRPGMTGRASIKLRDSNVWGALWWTVRRGIRSDILL